MEDNFFTDPGLGSGFGMIQVHYMYCAPYVYYDYISSTSDHQALDPRGGGPPAFEGPQKGAGDWSMLGLSVVNAQGPFLSS